MNNSLTPVEKYIPKRSEVLTEYEISIRFVSVGCLIRVGCKEFAFQDINEGISELNRYFKDPYAVKEEWYKFFDSQK